MVKKVIFNLKDEKGSFTIEATYIGLFIMIVVINIYFFIMYMYDVSLIHENINEMFCTINKEYEYSYDSDGLEKNEKKLKKLCKKESQIFFEEKHICIDIIKGNVIIDDNSVGFDISYRIKKSNPSVLRFIYNDMGKISRNMVLYDIKQARRKIDY